MRSASSRILRFSPRSAARSSTGPPRRLASASASAGSLGQLALHDEQRGNRHVSAVVLQHELLGHLREVALGLVRQVERLAIGEHPVAHLEHLRVGLAAVHRDGNRVERPHRLVGHTPALHQRADRSQPVALERGLLELLSRGRGAHALLQIALDHLEATR